ncbi:hypothetical protein [Roseiconus lacunae]|uniref:Helix-turn-helix domain-containing protein n=1 Tax=Roseiconus lacunae TaxID=2605694 RepID=A0ABT7PEN5_9BACT|nr:hypothetical protein [Roseiconus lacunae]MDM4014696.1 hypothetical protein [Roseiconus lacunae]
MLATVSVMASLAADGFLFCTIGGGGADQSKKNPAMTKFDHSIFGDETDSDLMERFNTIAPDDSSAIGSFVIDQLNEWLRSETIKTDAAIESAKELGIAAMAMRDGAEASKATVFMLGAVYTRWAVQAIGLERIAGMGHNSERAMRSQQSGQPITDEARQLFRQGVAIRKVAERCKVSRRVAERWRREFLKN